MLVPWCGLRAAAAGMPGHRLVAVGVTGTNGKSTVATMVHWALNQSGRRCGLVGTVEIDTGGRRLPAGLTTPDPADLTSYLSEMRQAGRTHVVMEASSHGLEQRRTDGVRFHAAVFTNFSVDHLDYHASVEEYFAAKSRLFEMLSPAAWAVLNADDARWRTLAARTPARVVTFGESSEALVRADRLGDRALRVTAPGFAADGDVPGLAPHRVQNALAVLATSVALGVEPVEAWQAILRFPGLWRRLQVIEREPTWVVDDCAHNPANISAAVQAMGALRPRRLWTVYAIRGSRGVAINRVNAMALCQAVQGFDHRLVITAADDLAGPNDRVLPEERLAFVDAVGHLSYRFEPTVEVALARVLAEREPGDVVLLLGAHAMDTAQDVWRRLSGSVAARAEPCAQTRPA